MSRRIAVGAASGTRVAQWTQAAAEALVGQRGRLSAGIPGGYVDGEVVACALVVEDRLFDVPATYLLVTVEAP